MLGQRAADDPVGDLRRRLGAVDLQQIAIWRAMSGSRRLDIACQAYQMVLDMVRVSERRRYPDLSEEELAWRVTRRMQGDPGLGRECHVIQPATGAKVDLVPLGRDPFSRLAFQRRRRLDLDESGRSAFFITPEDYIVAKLIAYRQTGSDKHLRDARGVLMMQAGTLNLTAVRRLADNIDMLDTLTKLLATLPTDSEESS